MRCESVRVPRGYNATDTSIVRFSVIYFICLCISGAVEIGATNRDVVCGYICQTRVSGHAGDLHWTPGVNLDATSDNAGQQWRGIEQAIVQQQNDIIIVGRGVTASKSPVNELKRYRAAAWEALTAGHQNGN